MDSDGAESFPPRPDYGPDNFECNTYVMGSGAAKPSRGRTVRVAQCQPGSASLIGTRLPLPAAHLPPPAARRRTVAAPLRAAAARRAAMRRMARRAPAPALALALALALAPALTTALRVNDTQVLRAHNSYHVASLGAATLKRDLRYRHAPLAAQLRAGLRGAEFDVYPRLAVFHVPGDYGTRCATLAACVAPLAAWSSAHPAHAPLHVLLEFKRDDALALVSDAEKAAAEAFGGRARFVSPAEVRGDADTLRAGAAAGWPPLADARGRVLVSAQTTTAVEQSPEWDAFFADPSRLFFGLGRAALGAAERSACVFIVPRMDDPAAEAEGSGGEEEDDLPALLRAGVLLRMRADENLVLDPDRRAAALRYSHVVDTDFEGSDGEKKTFFRPRCHPDAIDCRPGDVEEDGEAGAANEAKNGFWCCSAPAFEWVVSAVAVLPAVAVVLMMLCACVMKRATRERGALLCLAFANALKVLLTRLWTDGVVRRDAIEADDLLLSCAAVLSAAALALLVYRTRLASRLATPLVVAFAVVTVGAAGVGVIVSGAGGARQLLGYGVLDRGRAFLWLVLADTFAAITVLASIARTFFSSASGMKASTVLPQTGLVAAHSPLLLLLSGLGNIGALEPRPSLANLGTRVVLWHSLVVGVLLIAVFVYLMVRDGREAVREPGV